jgi:hypothetical protein
MARGPDGVTLAAELDDASGLNPAELTFTLGLEKIIDGALTGYRPGMPFVYGIHQALSPRMIEALRARYREAGWGEVLLREGATGAYMLVLRP